MLSLTFLCIIHIAFSFLLTCEDGSPGTPWCETKQMCEGDNNYVRAISVRHGSRIDKIGLRCSKDDWKGSWGGNGGAYEHYYARDYAFCGIEIHLGDWVDKIKIWAAKHWGASPSRVWGGSGGGVISQHHCNWVHPEQGKRLKGLTIQYSSDRVRGVTAHWEDNPTCAPFLLVRNMVSNQNGLNGAYRQRPEWRRGHPVYEHVNGKDCLWFYGNGERWKFTKCEEIANTYDSSRVFYKASDLYKVCPEDLSGEKDWQSWNGNDWVKHSSFSRIQLDTYAQLPITWSDTIGFWRQAPASEGAGSYSVVWSQSKSQAITETLTTEQRQSFGSEFTEGTTVGVTAKFPIGDAGAEFSVTKSQSQTWSESTTNAVKSSFAVALTDSSSYSEGCENVFVEGQKALYQWGLYRASNIPDAGMKEMTCMYQIQFGACKALAPNCPAGKCQDDNCVECYPYVDPITPVYALRAELPGCFDSIDDNSLPYANGPNVRCDPNDNHYGCCTADEPCKAGEGDCHNDDHCMGNLVCLHNVKDVAHDLGWSDYVTFANDVDVCGYPKFKDEHRRSLKGADSKSTEAADNATADDLDFKENPHKPASGCGQFDDEDHCSFGPLYKSCKWSKESELCEQKPGVPDTPTADFTWIYKNAKYERKIETFDSDRAHQTGGSHANVISEEASSKPEGLMTFSMSQPQDLTVFTAALVTIGGLSIVYLVIKFVRTKQAYREIDEPCEI